MLKLDRNVVGDQVHSLKKRHHGTVVPLRRFFLLPDHHVLQAGVGGAFSACTTCGRRGASEEKKSVGSWFDAESASPLGGELS